MGEGNGKTIRTYVPSYLVFLFSYSGPLKGSDDLDNDCR